MNAFRKILQLLVYYVTPISLCVYGIYMYASASLNQFRHWAEELGSPAWIVFLVLIFASPLYALLPKILKFIPGLILPFRRELGLFVTWLVFFHTIFLIIAATNLSVVLVDIFDLTSTWSWGTLAAIAIFIMGITSNSISVAILKRAWKKVHYLAYVVLITGILHVAIAENTYTDLLVTLPIYLLLKGLVIYKNRQVSVMSS